MKESESEVLCTDFTALLSSLVADIYRNTETDDKNTNTTELVKRKSYV
jgi:hypothetical protein